MSRDDEDLRINTLHALSKHSPRLVLEEHGHCEVPAGCGGVVLRWRDPLAGTPAILSVVCAGLARAWLDGVELASGYLSLRPGPHELTLELRELGEVPSPVLVAVVRQEARDGPALFASAPGSTWQARPLDAPDSAFAPMAPADDLLPAVLAGRIGWRYERAVGLGAQPLRAEAAAIVIRATFVHREAP